MAAASAAGSALNSGLLLVGNTIFCAASWVVTWLSTKLWPQSMSPPPTARTAARTSPATDASTSNVFLRIVDPSLDLAGPVRPGDVLFMVQSSCGAADQGQGSLACHGGTSVTCSPAESPACLHVR